MGFFKFGSKSKKTRTDKIIKLSKNFELPSFPANIMQILAKLRDPNAKVNEITSLIENDPGLHVKILKTVNSPAFGMGREVANINHAIKLLGHAKLESIVLTNAVKGNIPKFELGCFNHVKFWLYSARRATLARILASKLHPKTQVESFTAGLLLDIAMPIIIDVHKEKYCTIWNGFSSLDGYQNILAKEQKELGENHAELGGKIAESWNFPKYLCNNIRYHHCLSDWEDKVEPAVHIVANIFNENEEECLNIIAPILFEQYQIDTDELEPMISEAYEKAENLSKNL